MRNKYFILSVIALIGFIILLSCNKSKLDEKALIIYIAPTGEGYEIYSKDKELLLEFTKRNTDSSSLETLGYIYETSKENRATPPDEENKENKALTSVKFALQK